MVPLVEVEVTNGVMWPALLTETNNTTCPKHRCVLLTEPNVYHFKDLRMTVAVPAIGCTTCGFVYRPRYENRVVRQLIDQKLEFPFQPSLFPQRIRISPAGIERKMILGFLN